MISPSATMTTTTLNNQALALGSAVPPFTAHAISVSLPTWRDNVEYEAREKRVMDVMVSGYPRFFIHPSIEKLARICETRFGVSGERCLLYPSTKTADHCRAYIVDQSSHPGFPVAVRVLQYLIFPEDQQDDAVDAADCSSERSQSRSSSRSTELHIVLFPAEVLPLARLFWQYTGMGISSRLADHCLSMLPEGSSIRPAPPPPTYSSPIQGHNQHFMAKASISLTNGAGRNIFASQQASLTEDLSKDDSMYLEEQFGHNLPVASAAAAKNAMRRRIAGVLVHDSPEDCSGKPCASSKDVETGPSSRGVTDVTEDDVYLFPTGMSAIWNAHHLASMTRPAAKSVCFGFPYTDTLKILQKWGPGCHFLGHGLDTDIKELENILEQEQSSSATPPVLALFTEFPSNPLLRSPNLPRFRDLADKYDFLIVVDDTIGNFGNVDVLPYADIVVSSLSKIFSGGANVMGGSLILNPSRRHYQELKAYMDASYEDVYFDEDAIFMERNSRDLRKRISVINKNAAAISDFFRSHSRAGGVPSSVVKEIFYPKWMTRDNYEHCRIKCTCLDADRHDASCRDGGFGGLFSLTFTTAAASRVFFDTLSCLKGPSHGTNFTLACPYTILAHYMEIDWAAEYGVEESLIRVSIGMEEKGTLLRCFDAALKAAEGTSESQ